MRRIQKIFPNGKTKTGIFHQFMATHDGDQYIVPAAIVELEDGTVTWWEVSEYRPLRFLDEEQPQ